jgi:shikimate dehydrogenase
LDAEVPMMKVCVIGQPVAHSRSPLIHNYWIREMGIDARYEAREVGPAELKDFIHALPASPYVGCNVTLPHKEEVAKLVDEKDTHVLRAGSANTIYVRSGKTCATSTDGHGFVQNVAWTLPAFSFTDTRVTIIGAGGSCRAIVDELLRVGAKSVCIANRTITRAVAVSEVFGSAVNAVKLEDLPNVLADTDLLVNTTSLGALEGADFQLAYDALHPSAVVCDINYVPLHTPFLSRAEALGFRTVPGLGMLLHQAVGGFELWFGRKPEVTRELYDLVASDIAK